MAIPKLQDAARSATQAYKAAWRAALAAGKTAQQAAAQARRAAAAISSRAQALARTTTRHYTTYTRTVYTASLEYARRDLARKQKEITALVRSEIVLSLYAISKSVLYLKRLVDQLWESRYWILKRVVALEERVAKLKKEEEKSWLERIFGLKIADLIEFFKEFPKKITNFFRDPWTFLWSLFSLDTFVRSLSQAILDNTGERKVFEDHFKELPTPFEIMDETGSEITQVKPEMAPSLSPLIRENVQAIAREKTKEWERAWATWERMRKEIRRRLEL